MRESRAQNQVLLRNALLSNALFAILSGMAIAVYNHRLATFLGLPGEVNLIALAIGLAGYAVMLLINARRPNIKLADAWIAVIMDSIWVLGSYVLLFIVPFSADGKWLIVLLAEVVFAFAVLQIFGIRRVTKGQEPARAA
jgi:hypothetical protein